jgi:iron(II)-dependent oxidoreductase
MHNVQLITSVNRDARSQFDLINAMPGGLPGVRAVVDELHKAGVKVLLPYNP